MDQIKTGKFIAAERRRRGLTQREFAERLGISDKTVSKWECGNGMPEVSLMLSVCDALGINLNELFSGERIPEADYRRRAEENMLMLAEETAAAKANIVGGRVLGQAMTMDRQVEHIHRTNAEFWNADGDAALGAISLPDYGAFVSEDALNLFGDLRGRRVLELGCGRGDSLKYAFERGASELYGIDIAPRQIERARANLAARGIQAKLVCAPMEAACGIPVDYFDFVYSIYGIGWTTDLDLTFRRIHSYLKPGGALIFSWSHPVHKCVSSENGRLVFCNSYFDEAWYRADLDGEAIVLANRKLSTYVNALADNGFVIEKLVEETDGVRAEAENTPFGKKARMLPVTFVIRARRR